jgi:hypothetical protein
MNNVFWYIPLTQGYLSTPVIENEVYINIAYYQFLYFKHASFNISYPKPLAGIALHC